MTQKPIKVAFLDRDGVINKDIGYLHKISECIFLPHIFTGAQLLKQLGYQLIIITNQSGIGRGLYDEAQYLELMNWMLHNFEQHHVTIMDHFHCPHHPTEARIEKYRINCNCRKPKTGLIEQACQKHPIDLSQSLLIGNNISDIKTAINAHIPTHCLITDKNPIENDIVQHIATNVHQFAQQLQQQT